MRVVAGIFRGRSLSAPPGTTTRPITSRVKETLFNILGHRCATPGALPDLAVLDLFAGSGSLGIEALSRGAGTCTFVERDRRALRVLRENLERLGVASVAKVLADNAWTMRIPQPEQGFGVVFVDPPYREVENSTRVLDLLERLAPHLAADGVVVFRHEVHISFPADQLRTLRCVDERRFSRMRVLFMTAVEDDTNPAPSPSAEAEETPPP